MNGRRGFLALVGGSLVTGTIGQSDMAQQPTLLLPPRDIIRAAEIPAALPGRSVMQQTALGMIGANPAGSAHPLLAAQQTQMHGFLTVAEGLPRDIFLDWLEGGLRMVEGCKPGGSTWRAMQAEGRA